MECKIDKEILTFFNENKTNIIPSIIILNDLDLEVWKDKIRLQLPNIDTDKKLLYRGIRVIGSKQVNTNEILVH